MKATLFVPPLLALAVVATWVGSQRHSISTLEGESQTLQKHIRETREALAGADAAEDRSTGPAKSGNDNEPIDWKEISGKLAGMNQGGMPDMRVMMRLQKRLLSMDKEEIAAALDEIATLDLPDDARNMLENMLIGPLVQKDPEYALTRFAGRLRDDDGSLRWQLSTAMSQWAKKDPVAATAWFDQQIAAGTFDSKSLDGKSQTRIQFEGSLISQLLKSDPDAASSRLGAMPEDQRNDAMHNFAYRPIKEEDQPAFARIVREQLPEDEQAETIARQAARLVAKDDFSKVTAYMNRIDATESERSACVEQAASSRVSQVTSARAVSREDIDSIREWAGTASPESTDRITGSVLSESMNQEHKLEFSEAAELAVQYNQNSANDEVLATFLESWHARNHQEQARELAARISDVERREKILEKPQVSHPP